MSIAENIARVRAEIAQAAQEAGSERAQAQEAQASLQGELDGVKAAKENQLKAYELLLQAQRALDEERTEDFQKNMKELAALAAAEHKPVPAPGHQSAQLFRRFKIFPRQLVAGRAVYADIHALSPWPHVVFIFFHYILFRRPLSTKRLCILH